MKLVLDIGNTLVKAGIFEKKNLIEIISTPAISVDFVKSIISKYPDVSRAILSSVKEISPDVIQHLKKSFRFIEFSVNTPIPITNLYTTPSTLGNDRLAGVIGAHALYPGANALVIDAGTCITYDMVSRDGIYKGGSISPGLAMRFNALHAFTGRLPLVSLTDFDELVGTDTERSILSGVINGVVAEIGGIMEQYALQHEPLKVVMCGGDGHFLAVRLKSSIFAVPELVLIGLNEILDHNEL